MSWDEGHLEVYESRNEEKTGKNDRIETENLTIKTHNNCLVPVSVINVQLLQQKVIHGLRFVSRSYLSLAVPSDDEESDSAVSNSFKRLYY